MPCTTPALLTVASEVLLLVQVPPAEPVVAIVTFAPGQTVPRPDNVPETAEALTETVAVEIAVAQVLETE